MKFGMIDPRPAAVSSSVALGGIQEFGRMPLVIDEDVEIG